MTTEQQRIKIAKACGWTCCGYIEGRSPFGLHPMFNVQDYSVQQIMALEVPIGDLPDYIGDLNAMHEAEIGYIIPNGLWDDYVTHLRNLMKDGERFWGQATAKQRAEAFLRTLNLWEK